MDNHLTSKTRWQRIGKLLLRGLLFGGSLVVFHFFLLGLHFLLIAILQNNLLSALAPKEREPLIALFNLIQRLAPFFYLLFCALYLYILGLILTRRSGNAKQTYITGWFIGIGYAILAIPLLLLLVEPISHATWYQQVFTQPCFSPFQELDCTLVYPEANAIRETGLMVIAIEALLLSWLATSLYGWSSRRKPSVKELASE